MFRGKEFLLELKSVLRSKNHEYEVDGDTVTLTCFGTHLRDVNNALSNPFTEVELVRVY